MMIPQSVNSLVHFKTKAKHRQQKEHYTITIPNNIGRGPTAFQSSKELLSALGDAAEAHQQVYDAAGILHGDISVGNIIITHEGKGLLIDWDISKTRDEIENRDPQLKRMATYQFMAARFVDPYRRLDSPYCRLDDLESFFHVLQWIMLCYTDHGMSARDLRYTLNKYYDPEYPFATELLRCAGRLWYLQFNDLWAEAPQRHAVLKYVEEIREILSSRYNPDAQTEKMQQMYELYLQIKESGRYSKEDMELFRPAVTPIILLLKTEEQYWFRDLLREAANDESCPTDDPSILQTYPHRGY